MELQIAGTNTEITPATQRYVERKLGKLNRHLPDIIDIKVEISEEKTKSPQQHYLVRVTVNSGVADAVFHGEERGEDLFKAVDKVVTIMTRQLERHKGKLYDKGRGNPLARGKYISQKQPVPRGKWSKPSISSLSRCPGTRPSSRWNDSAIISFFFLMPITGEVRLLYRRNDGNYGLIEPEFK